MTIDQWLWMMDYCKSKGIPPAQPWAWTEAETAWRTGNAVVPQVAAIALQRVLELDLK